MIKNNDIQSTFENIKSYFETYVKTYQPYKDNPVFKSILETLIDTYYKHLYIDVPSNLLDLVVKNVVNPRTNIDYVLVEIGLPEKLIKKLSISEKWIFFQIFADFIRYKSTIQFFQTLGKASETSFPEKFSIYELWIDRDEEGNWILRPLPIYEAETASHIVVDDIPYSTVYQKIPNLLISEEQLQTWYDNNQLILPFKSNLILLRQFEVTEVSEISGLLRAAFLKHFGSFDVNLYFIDATYTANLRFIDSLWNYLILRYYDSTQPEKDFGKILLFLPENAAVPDVTQIESIIQEYSSINSWDEYSAFYETYLKPFETNYHQQSVDSTSLHDSLFAVNPDLINYIGNRINNAQDAKTEISIILDEIYGSLLLSTVNYANDIYYQQYLPVYINLLPRVITDVDANDIEKLRSFAAKIVYTLKPFHTDVILEVIKAIASRDTTFVDDSDISVTIDITRKLFDLYRVGYFCGGDYSDYKFVGLDWGDIPVVGEIYVSYFTITDSQHGDYRFDLILPNYLWKVSGTSHVVRVGEVDVGDFNVNEIVHETNDDTLIVGDSILVSSDQDNETCPFLKPLSIEENINIAEEQVDLQQNGFYVGDFIVNDGETITLKEPNYKVIDIQPIEHLEENVNFEDNQVYDVTDTGLLDEQIAGYYGIVGDITVSNFRVIDETFPLPALADVDTHTINTFSENCRVVEQRVGDFIVDTIKVGDFIVNSFNVAQSDFTVASSQIIGASRNLYSIEYDFSTEVDDVSEFSTVEEEHTIASDYLAKYIVGSLVLVGQFSIGNDYIVGSDLVVDTPPEYADGDDTFVVGNFIVGSCANKLPEADIDTEFNEKLNVSNVNVGNQIIVADIAKIGDITVGVFVVAQPDSDNYFTVGEHKSNLIGSGIVFTIYEYKYSRVNSQDLKIGLTNLYVTEEGFVQIF